MTRERTVRRRRHREQLWLAQDKICFLCGKKMYPVSHTNRRFGWSDDHVRPASKGHSRVRNVLLAHAECNRAKEARDPTACELLLLDAVNAKLTIWQDHVLAIAMEASGRDGETRLDPKDDSAGRQASPNSSGDRV